jgi:hypothetical protein
VTARSAAVPGWLPALTPRRVRLVSLAGALLFVQLLALAAYLLVTGAGVVAPRYLLYPTAWITVGVLAVVATDPPTVGRRARLLAGGVAGAYLLALASLGGVLGPASLGDTLRIVWLPPGWGPALLARGFGVNLAVHPYELIGYGALAYLVYATVLDAAGPVGGVVGFGACVGCAAPGIAGLVGVLGGSAGAVSVATSLSYDLSTLVFLVAVGLLYWRPVGGSLGLGRPGEEGEDSPDRGS